MKSVDFIFRVIRLINVDGDVENDDLRLVIQCGYADADERARDLIID